MYLDLISSSTLFFRFYAADSFGDGWGSVRLSVSDNKGFRKILQPTQDANEQYLQYCFDQQRSADGDRLVAAATGILPNHPWEMYWTVTVSSSSADPWICTGTYMTYFVFIYHRPRDDSPKLIWLTLDRHLNALTENSPCTGCLRCLNAIGERCESSLRLGRDEFFIPYSLYGINNQWSSLNGYGTTFDIFSADRKQLYASGRLCDTAFQDECGAYLSMGNYIWRVTGALDRESVGIAWRFCDQTGGASTELTFEIDEKGRCIPGEKYAPRDENFPLSESENKLIVYNLRHIIVVKIFQNISFSEEQLHVIETVVGQIFNISSRNIQASYNMNKEIDYASVSPTANDLYHHTIDISMQLILPSYVDGDYSASEGVIHNETNMMLKVSADSGLFAMELQFVSRQQGVVGFHDIHSITINSCTSTSTSSSLESFLSSMPLLPLVSAYVADRGFLEVITLAVGALLVLVPLIALLQSWRTSRPGDWTRLGDGDDRADISSHIEAFPINLNIQTIHRSDNRISFGLDVS